MTEGVNTCIELSSALEGTRTDISSFIADKLNIPFITAIAESTINISEFKRPNIDLFLNLRRLYKIELDKILSFSSSSSSSSSFLSLSSSSSSPPIPLSSDCAFCWETVINTGSPEIRKKAMIKMLFKFDSLHDFIGERNYLKGDELKDFNNNLYEVLGWDKACEKEIVENIIKSDFENSLFMWLIFDGLKALRGGDGDFDKYYDKKVIITESIQNFVKKVAMDKYKSVFTIDAGLKDFNTFAEFLRNIAKVHEEINLQNHFKILQYMAEVESLVYKYKKIEIEETSMQTDTEETTYINKNNKRQRVEGKKDRKEKKIVTEQKYHKTFEEAKTCIYNILLSSLDDKDMYRGISTIDAKNEEKFFQEIFNNETANYKKCKNKYGERFMANLKSNELDIDNIKQNDNFNNSIIKLFINYVQTNFNDVDKTKCEGKIDKKQFPKNIVKKIYENMSLDLDESKEFKIIAPQKFDANRTTGGTWLKESIDNIKFLSCCNKESKQEAKDMDFDVDFNLEEYKDYCSFDVLDDKCYFYSEGKGSNVPGNDKKVDGITFIFEINNANYPIQKIIVAAPKKIESFTSGKDKEKPIILLDNFKYFENEKTLYCTNAPGVTELIQLYQFFQNPKYYDKKFKGPSYVSNVVLNNILTIKRAGDYSQIWFCKKFNGPLSLSSSSSSSSSSIDYECMTQDISSEKLFFMSNDRMSASFCLVEKVPFVCQIKTYGVYFNPFLPKKIEGKISYTDFENRELVELILKKHNEIIVNFDNCLGTRDTLEKYLTFINDHKNNFQQSTTNLLLLLKYQDDIIFNQNKYYCIDDNDIDSKECKEINYVIPPTIEKSEQNSNNIIQFVYEKLKSFAISNDDIDNMCSDILKDAIGKGYKIPDYKTRHGSNKEKEDSDDDEKEEEKEVETIEDTRLNDIQNINTFENDDQNWNSLTDKITNEDYTKNNPLCGLILDHIIIAKKYHKKLLRKIRKTPSDETIKNDISIYKKIITKLQNRINECDNSSEINNLLFGSPVPSLTRTQSTGFKNEIPLNQPGWSQNKDVQEYLKHFEKYYSDDEDTSPSMIESFEFFSFENGLTHYKIYPEMPVVIPTESYKHANNFYVMDRNGYISVEGNVKGNIMLENRFPKTKTYSDGTRITYNHFL